MILTCTAENTFSCSCLIGFSLSLIPPLREYTRLTECPSTTGRISKPRLTIRPLDNDFFKKYVLEDFDNLIELDDCNQDTEAKNNIIKNSRLILEKIKEFLPTSDDIMSFGAFLIQRCYIVTVSTPNKTSAFRIFSVMNSRGMSLLATDIIKADVIGAINESDKRKIYTDKWEEMEVELTRNGFNELFAHIRMIKMKVKAQKSLQEEFYKFVIPDITSNSAIDFIDNILTHYSEAYSVIIYNDYKSSSYADKVNKMLRWLNRIDNSDWIPVAMLYYTKNSNDSVGLYNFLEKLERLAAFMRASSWDINQRIARYAKVLEEIEATSDGSFGDSIELTNEEILNFLDILNSDIYTMTSKKRNYLILRLDSFVSDGAASYDSKILTIEHVLPQTVHAGSDWESKWPEKARKQWLHKIANLLPLSRRKNSEAQNYDFKNKKEKYFMSKSGISSYALTTQVLGYEEWTPDIVEKRQEKLIGDYINGWNLKIE